MSAKAAVYHVQGRNSTTSMTGTDQPRKPRKKSERTAEKNISNGTLAKNSAVWKRVTTFSLALTLFISFL
jgi:hypothetical protein